MNNQIPALKQKINAAVKALMKEAFDANFLNGVCRHEPELILSIRS